MLSNPVKGLGRWGVRSLCSADPAPFQGPRVASPFTYSPIPHAQRARPSGSHDVRAAFTRPYQAVARPAVLRLLTDTHKSCVFNRSCWHQNAYPAGVLVSCSLTWAGFACSMCPYCSPALNDLGPRPPPMTAYRTRDCGNCRAYTVIWGTFRKPRKRRAVSPHFSPVALRRVEGAEIGAEGRNQPWPGGRGPRRGAPHRRQWSAKVRFSGCSRF